MAKTSDTSRNKHGVQMEESHLSRLLAEAQRNNERVSITVWSPEDRAEDAYYVTGIVKELKRAPDNTVTIHDENGHDHIIPFSQVFTCSVLS